MNSVETNFVDISELIRENNKDKNCFKQFCKDLLNLLLPAVVVISIISIALIVGTII